MISEMLVSWIEQNTKAIRLRSRHDVYPVLDVILSRDIHFFQHARYTSTLAYREAPESFMATHNTPSLPMDDIAFFRRDILA
jgi:hypothetical protein